MTDNNGPVLPLAHRQFALTSAFVVVGLVECLLRGGDAHYLVGACAMVLFSTVPLLFRSTTGRVMTISAACVVTALTFGVVTVGAFIALGVAVSQSDRRAGYAISTAVSLAALGWALSGDQFAVVAAAALPVAMLSGVIAQLRNETRANEDAANALAGTALEHVARGERARIARELHDVVAHHISIVSVQAETARLTTPGLPEEGVQRFTEIGNTARAALAEMRRLLGVLREDADQPLPTEPQPGLAQLAALINSSREASGAQTRLIMKGSPVPMDAGIEVIAYRVVQEALTNARRHAPGAAVDVELAYAPDHLQLSVRDNGPGPAEDLSSNRHGLVGMRERVASTGGRLEVGRANGGGFLVQAWLPMSVQ